MAILAFFFAAPSPAQNPPPPPPPPYNAGTALEQATPPPAPNPPPPDPGEPLILQKDQTAPTNEKQIYISDFKLVGAPASDRQALEALLTPYRGRKLTMGEILEAANKVTSYFRGKGYIVAKAYVPTQDAKGGVLTLDLVIGKYGTVKIQNDSHVRNKVISEVFDQMKMSSPEVTRDSLERAILLVNEMPGSKLPTATIAAGSVPGTSDFDITVPPENRISGYLMADNQGSQYTGRFRFFTGININSPFGIADQFSIIAMSTPEGGLQDYGIGYNAPLRDIGGRGQIAFAHTTYGLSGGAYTGLDATGLVNSVVGTWSYPLIRRRDQSVDISQLVTYESLTDNIGSLVENQRYITAGAFSVSQSGQRRLWNKNFYESMSGALRIGGLRAASGPTNNIFTKLNFNATGTLALSEKWTSTATLRLQQDLSPHTLDSSEQIFLNGPSGVRSYSEGISGDNGYVLNLQLQRKLPNFFRFSQSAGLFADNGGMYMQQKTTSLSNSTMLSDVGGLYSIGIGRFYCTAYVAATIGGSAFYNEPSRVRALFQAGISF